MQKTCIWIQKTICCLLCAIFLLLFTPFLYAQNAYRFAQSFGEGILGSSFAFAVDRDENVFVGNTFDFSIEKYDNNQNLITSFGTWGYDTIQFRSISGVTVDNNGNIIIADQLSNRFQKFDNNGNYLFQYSLLNIDAYEFLGEISLAVDSSGNSFVSDTDTNSIKILDTNGNYVSQFGTYGSGNGQLNRQRGVALDSSGNIYVADFNNHRIQKFDHSGNYLSQFGTYGTGQGQFEFPYGVALDSEDNIFVTDGVFNHIQKFDKNFRYLSQFGNFYGVPAWLSGITVSKNGNVFVASEFIDSPSRVLEFVPIVAASLSGTITFQGLVPDAGPQNVTFTFSPGDGSVPTTQTLTVPASGAFTLNGEPSNIGTLHIKGDRYLAVNIPVDLRAGDMTGATAALLPGDANNDNIVDIADFGLLINVYGDIYDVTDPNANPSDVAADCNGDGMVDANDLNLLINSWGIIGDP